MFEVTVTQDFAAAHRLYGYQGQCANLHGHTWKVQVS
ncbi:MAG: 6-carboxytetrahydropterin synthase, partial [Syntrophomonadaceae bacterium]